MEVKQIEYIVKIADERSITRAAEKLYLTQSALNQQLLRLERELGTQLFYRTKTDCTPTPVGEVYLNGAREILRIRKQTMSLIHDMTQIRKGHLSIGFTPGRGSEMFTRVYPAFHQLFPEVIVEPRELSVRRQQEQIARGDLDIGFQTLAVSQRTADSYIRLGSEELFLVIPAGHPLAMPSGEQNKTGEAAAPPVLDIMLLQYEPFVLMYKESTTRAIIDEIFRKSGFVPHILFETSSNQTIISMIQARLCCSVIPQHYLKSCPEGLACFSFASHPTWDIVASYKRNTYLSDPARAFIELAKQHWLAGPQAEAPLSQAP